MSNRELTPIEVMMHPNGYELKVHGRGYMYFNELELFEGLCYHAGMAIVGDTDKKVIRDVVANLLAGDTAKLMERNQEQQNDIVKLEAKIKKLTADNQKLTKKMERLEKKLKV